MSSPQELPVDTSVSVGSVNIDAIAAGDNNIGNVDIVTMPNVTLNALPAGNNNIGDVDVASIAAGDNNIGNVDIVTMPNVTLNALPAGTNNIGDVDVLTVATGWTLQRTAGSDPAAGAEATVSIPANELWEILQIEVTLVTSATAANRCPNIRIHQAGTTYLYVPTYEVVTASLTRRLLFMSMGTWMAGPNIVDTGGVTLQPSSTWPQRVLVGHASGLTITTDTGNIQAGDNYGAMSVTYRRWQVAPPWYVTA